MEWFIETLRVLREVRDWAGGRQPSSALGQNTQMRIENATEALQDFARARAQPLGPARTYAGPDQKPRRPRKKPRGTRQKTPQPRGDQAIPIDLIDRNALSALRRLHRFGYKAYLVGGCVRDLLLDLPPKDFDVVTNARPEDVRSVFRNSRIIGRRFRLAHLYYHDGKIIEVSTFRAQAPPPSEDGEEKADLLIRRDNVFGTEEEDARRRDFTINGLFYDLAAGRIIDHVGGLKDIKERHLRMIGDPEIRLQEDPIRILRALRFQARANLTIDPELLASMKRYKTDVKRCAPARVLEETLKLLRTGHAERTVSAMAQTGILEVLMPDIDAFLKASKKKPADTASSDLFAHLKALDQCTQKRPVSDAVVLGALLYVPASLCAPQAKGPERQRQHHQYLAHVSECLGLTRRISEELKQALSLQRHFGPTALEERSRRRKLSPKALMRRAAFEDALDLYEIHALARAHQPENVEQWRAKSEVRSSNNDDRSRKTNGQVRGRTPKQNTRRRSRSRTPRPSGPQKQQS